MFKLTVAGSGFAGLTAVQTLRKEDPTAEITVISPKSEFVYLPSLIWIPSGQRRSEQLRIPLEQFFQRKRVKHLVAEVTGLKDDGRVVLTDQGEITNDGLIIASGGRFIKKLPGIEHSIGTCEGIVAVEKLKERLTQMEGGTIAAGFAGNPQEPTAMRGGPMFEFLFGIDQQLRREGRRERFKLIFFSPSPNPGNRLGPKAVGRLIGEMTRRGIETHLGHKLKGFTSSKVMTEGEDFDADLILFTPGMTGQQWFDTTDLPRSEGGFIRADQFCKVPNTQGIYVAGDAGSFPGPEWMPKQGHMADLQAKTAAYNLLKELQGERADKTYEAELVCILDDNRSGTLVARTNRYGFMLPPTFLLHWAKSLFEWWYMRRYR
jgi:sulfide:quinone oxidoreductase